MKRKKSSFNYFITLILIIASIMLIFSFVDIGNKPKEISISSASVLVQKGSVAKIYTIGGTGYILLNGDLSGIKESDFPKSADYKFDYTSSSIVILTDAIKEYNDKTITDNNADTDVTNDKAIIEYNDKIQGESFIESMLPWLYVLGFVIFGFFIFKMLSKSSGNAMNFGKNNAKVSENVKVRFTDIAGAEEEKEELKEIVEFLKNPQKFTEIGARIPKGVLLVGNPGTGKTLIAKAVAGESNVPFLSISGSDFVEMFVGVGASRVRDLFNQAKKCQPCIIFIDEIDAVGRKRGTGMGGGNDEREQTLNQLLVEMDGFAANEGIIILAATNRSDVLDPALLRPGRFDRQIYIHAPDVKGREGILKIHARNKKLAEGIDYTTLARITSGFTGADLENMLNEAAIIAARVGRTKIIMQDIQEGINKVLMGPQKKSLVVTDNDKLITAYHEAGHAILGKLLPDCEDVQEVSIIPRGSAAGYTMSRPENDDNHMSKRKLNDTIAMTMGGRVSEELFMKDIATGAVSDIKHATDIARKMVKVWGMSDKFGFYSLSSGGEDDVEYYGQKNSISETMAYEVDKEIKNILDKNYAVAKKLLQENKKIVKEMSELLLIKNTIYKEEVDMLMDGKSKEEVIAFMDENEKKRLEEQEKYKKIAEYEQKIKELDIKENTAKVYLKEGIISEQDFNIIIAEKEIALAKLKQQKIEECAKDTKDNNAVVTENKNIAESQNADSSKKQSAENNDVVGDIKKTKPKKAVKEQSDLEVESKIETNKIKKNTIKIKEKKDDKKD